jgi:transcriptional regulator with XRE-family HTH domain
MTERESSTEHVGQTLKQLRQGRGISIRELSRISGISANALSMIERGLTSPSVSTLYRLTDSLNIPITALFRQDQTMEPIVFRSVSSRTRVLFPLGVWEGLGGEAFSDRMHPFLINLESGAESGPEKIVHTGSEFVMCLQGKLEYEVEGKQYLLEVGDTLLFTARHAHRWRNATTIVTKAIIVISGFEGYEKPGAYHFPP